METPQHTTPSPKKPKRGSLARKHRNIAEYLTQDDIRAALDLMRRRINGGSTRAARYMLDLYFGKPSTSKLPPIPEPRKQNIRLTSEFFDKLSQKYFPKPGGEAQKTAQNG